MTYHTETTTGPDGEVVATVSNAEHRDVTYATVRVRQPASFERNTVQIDTEGADGFRIDLDHEGEGMMADAFARGLAAALTEHYARKDAL